MPFKRKYARTFRKRPNSQAAKALAMAKRNRSMINVEYKHHTVSQLLTTVTDAGTIVQLTAIPQGDTDIQRDGGSCKLTSLRLAYHMIINGSAVQTQVRVMIVHDRQTNQAQFTLADLLADATVNDAILSPYNVDNRRRFGVMYDKVHQLTIEGNNRAINRIFSRKLNHKIRFDGAAADVTDLTQDSLSLVLIGDQATNDPSVAFFYRVRYVDN